MFKWFKNLFSSFEYKKALANLKLIKRLAIKYEKMSDEQLQHQTIILKESLKNGKTLDDIQNDAFAIAKEATWRVLNKKLYDVQIIGGLLIHYGCIAEMKTGEGKTLSSIPPVYLNALLGNPVFVLTVNEYLAERDANETKLVHNFLGLTVGINKVNISSYDKRNAYSCDITYSIHSEIGFDYLRDNMVKSLSQKVQRGFDFVLIDEADSILIDESRTPLIITGNDNSSIEKYVYVDVFVKKLKTDDYYIDWESKGIQLTEVGIDKANKYFKINNIFDLENSELVHLIINSLRANYTMKKDVEYIVKDQEILLIDVFTGRIMEGRSYSDGLQQAIQAKENVEIDPENIVLATITYQNLFRMFKKISGMTGTAKTEEEEFISIYNTRVDIVPTNKPLIRIDHPNVIFANLDYKYRAIVNDIKLRYKIGQPVLLGTEEVSESEKISKLLTKANIPHTVLNAKQNSKEAEIIAQAGKKGSITIATNMAGRGTDIVLDDYVRSVGGLYVIGTNLAESRRIDNQLRGRSGRQGDVGESRFYISLDDTLIKRFSNQKSLKDIFSDNDERPIKSRMLRRMFKQAQIKIEGFNFDMRLNVLRYDDVIRQQRELFYSQRDIVLKQNNMYDLINKLILSVIKDLMILPIFKEKGQLNTNFLVESINRVWFNKFTFKIDVQKYSKVLEDEIIDNLFKDCIEGFDYLYQNLIENISLESAIERQRQIILETMDSNWQNHLSQMNKLRIASTFSSYAQKNPYQVYAKKGTKLFENMLQKISHNSVKLIMNDDQAIKHQNLNERETQISQIIENIEN